MLPCVLLIIAVGMPPKPVYSNGQYAYCGEYHMPLPGTLHGAFLLQTGVRYMSGDLLCNANHTWAGCQYLPYGRADAYDLYMDTQPRDQVFDDDNGHLMSSFDISDHLKNVRIVPMIDPAVPTIGAHYGNAIEIHLANSINANLPHETIHLGGTIRILAQISADQYIAEMSGQIIRYCAKSNRALSQMIASNTMRFATWYQGYVYFIDSREIPLRVPGPK